MSKDSLNTLDWDKITVDGHGYVVLDDNTRIDFADNDTEDIYKQDRIKWNENRI